MWNGNERRLALQLASQLPDSRDEALAVVDRLRELVEAFFEGDQSLLPLAPFRLLEGGAAALGSSPSRSAIVRDKPRGSPK